MTTKETPTCDTSFYSITCLDSIFGIVCLPAILVKEIMAVQSHPGVREPFRGDFEHCSESVQSHPERAQLLF